MPGKNNSKQKTREPYGKVTEVGQVPVALQEIKELCERPNKPGEITPEWRLANISVIVGSIISVTCANPGCISEMAEQ